MVRASALNLGRQRFRPTGPSHKKALKVVCAAFSQDAQNLKSMQHGKTALVCHPLHRLDVPDGLLH